MPNITTNHAITYTNCSGVCINLRRAVLTPEMEEPALYLKRRDFVTKIEKTSCILQFVASKLREIIKLEIV